MAYPAQQREGTGMVEVVPVIVRDQQVIDIRKILSRVGRGAREGGVEIGRRCGLGRQHRIDQDAASLQLYEV